ncbi:CsbD family protein [Streptomyces rimosus]|uniref:CsbD family protein n=1 Tax=Streptomyces rimosus TaxID=1927 RepID=UPI00099DC9EF|nr:CsbD family protein [Streptomyces rimosus]
MSATEKVKAKVEQLAGTVKKETGRAVGNDQTASEGVGDKVKGNLREAKEKVKDAFRD